MKRAAGTSSDVADEWCETVRLAPRRWRGRRDARKEELALPQTTRRDEMAAGDAEKHGEAVPFDQENDP